MSRETTLVKILGGEFCLKKYVEGFTSYVASLITEDGGINSSNLCMTPLLYVVSTEYSFTNIMQPLLEKSTDVSAVDSKVRSSLRTLFESGCD